jgi:miniconductance mechanosensitive channel
MRMWQQNVVSISAPEAEGVTDLVVQDAILLAAAVGLGLLAYFVVRKIISAVLNRIVARSQNQFDDLLVEHGVFRRLSHLLPALILYWAGKSLVLPAAAESIERLSIVYMIFAGQLAANAMLNAVADFYRRSQAAAGRPIKGYVQTVQLLLFLVAIIFTIATLMERSPWKLLSGLGAVSAILLLVFKDSIMGLVASVQISAYDMVKQGDWIEMPKYGADGDVVDVSLHTVKVQNWDKTITTIPTQALITDSFKNWRGMSESGGRRIKRALYIDMNSIRFCTDEMLDRFEKVHALADYIRSRRREVAEYNQERNVDRSILANGRNLTNIGCFRAYILLYLKSHPKIHSGMTLLVRQLAPAGQGLPIEIYCFTNDIQWAVYEDIQADLFDHLLAALPEFDLRVYQSPAGADVRELSARASVQTS